MRVEMTLGERAKKNHDAAPAARASVDSVATQPTTEDGRERTDKSPARPVDGTGDTQEPVAWAAVTKTGRPLWLSFSREDAVGAAAGMAGVAPLFFHPQPTLTDAERKAVETARMIFAQGGEHFDHASDRDRAATLRGLLERLG